jgi:hypothetical protein
MRNTRSKVDEVSPYGVTDIWVVSSHVSSVVCKVLVAEPQLEHTLYPSSTTVRIDRSTLPVSPNVGPFKRHCGSECHS